MLNWFRKVVHDYKWKHAKKKYEEYRKLNDMYNFQIPNFVSHWKWNSKLSSAIWEDGITNQEIIEKIKENNLSIYIWRIERNLNWRPYSEAFLFEMLSFMVACTWVGDKIVINIWNFVWESLNNSSDDRYFSRGEQIEYLKSLMARVSKKRLKDLEIVDLWDSNPELVQTISKRENDIESIDLEEMLSKWADSSGIFKFLLGLMRKYPEFKELMISPKPANENASDLYALTEISIRLQDLLSSNNFQWWSKLQSKFDAIISFLANPDIPNISYKSSVSSTKTRFDADKILELVKFREFIKEKLWWKDFEFLYFDTDECEKFYNLKEWRNTETETSVKKLRNIIMGIVIWAIWVWWPVTYFSSKAKKEQELNVKNAISKALENKVVSISLESWGAIHWVNNDQEKTKMAIDLAKDITWDLILIYWVSDTSIHETIFKFILQEVSKDEIMWYYILSGNDSAKMRKGFIDRLVLNNKVFLTYLWVNLKPYNYLSGLEDDFRKSIRTHYSWLEEWLQEMNKRFENNPDRFWYLLKNSALFMMSDWREVRICRFRSDPQSIGWIEMSSGSLIDHSTIINENPILVLAANGINWVKIETWEEVAYDYFWQSEATIRSMYENAENIFFWGSISDHKMISKLKKLIISDFLDNSKKILGSDIQKYIWKEFLKRNSINMLKLWLPISKFPKLQPYTEAIKRTSEYSWTIKYVWSYDKVKMLWSYLSSDWVLYDAWLASIEWKDYVIFCKSWDMDSDFRLDSYKQAIIAKEILKNLWNR